LLDDISMLRTIKPAICEKFEIHDVVWDTKLDFDDDGRLTHTKGGELTFRKSKEERERLHKAAKTFWNDFIATAHGARLQVFVGLGITTAVNTLIHRRFEEWLKKPSPQMTPEAFAQRIVAFLDESIPDYDGISCDIEFDPVKGGRYDPKTRSHVANNLKRMYQELARLLAEKTIIGRSSPRILAMATPAFVSRTHSHNIWTDADGKTLKGSASTYGDVASLHQVWDIVQGPQGKLTNILFRPMAYMNSAIAFQGALWHRDVVNFFAGAQGVGPEQFQLGVATSNDAILVDTDQAIRRRAEFLRGSGQGPKDRGGLIFFPHSSRQWLSANHFLNVLHGAPPAGLGGGQTLQQPVHTAPLAPPLQPPATTFPPNPIDLLASLADEWGTWPTPRWYA